ncbi:MAG: hypothetical protein HY059_23070 [Proteobacteria bacterium]|nr:hypothetical protein [Pseudomonadota bacterium]
MARLSLVAVCVLGLAAAARAENPWYPKLFPLPEMRTRSVDHASRAQFAGDVERALAAAARVHPIPPKAQAMLVSYLRLASHLPEKREWVGVINLEIRDAKQPNVFWVNVLRPGAVRAMRVPYVTTNPRTGARSTERSNVPGSHKYSLGIVEGGAIVDAGHLGLAMLQHGLSPLNGPVLGNTTMLVRGMFWHWFQNSDYTEGCFTSVAQDDLAFVYNEIGGRDATAAARRLSRNGRASAGKTDPAVWVSPRASDARGAVYLVWGRELEE